ncbi:MAG: imidazole glycerol phosphate synthase subunit HisH [Clostridiales bacterium]|nr:imidazole glycerol phosphate synthase subunit HisH [Clostridiales bacterium]
MISVIDYKAGNSQSVINALSKLGIEAKLVSASDELSRSDAVILPGVGSAGETMNSLRELGLIETLDDIVRKNGVPFLGICVGLQVLFDHSEEGDTECLHWLGGQVRRFGKDSGRVPQIGWNEVRFQYEHPLVAGLDKCDFFYFVNSYYAVPEDGSVILGRSDYGPEYCSMAASGNIFAAQFHIEKSGESGLRILRNFAAIANKRIAEGSVC